MQQIGKGRHVPHFQRRTIHRGDAVMPPVSHEVPMLLCLAGQAESTRSPWARIGPEMRRVPDTGSTPRHSSFKPRLPPDVLRPTAYPLAMSTRSALTPRRREGKLLPAFGDTGQSMRPMGLSLSPRAPDEDDHRARMNDLIWSAKKAQPPPAAQAVATVVASRDDAEALATHEMSMAAINSRFTNMMHAFKHIDLDNSGTVDRAEVRQHDACPTYPRAE